MCRRLVVLVVALLAVACADSRRSMPGASRDSGSSVAYSDTAAAFFDWQVTKDADPLPPIPKPTYPKALRAADMEGQVEVRFVVDTTGRIDTGSVRVLQSTHRYFTDAVLAVLPKMRFLPAEYRGKKVRRLRTQPFTFSLAP